jgi:hypothetical protein
MVTQEEVKSAVVKVDIDKLKQRAVGKIELDQIPAEKLNLIVYMAMHCCVNGPVGVNKKTNWPGSDELDGKSIKDFLTCSNSQWKGFCLIVVNTVDKNSPKLQDCYTVKNFGSLWPACDNVFKPKNKT